MWTCPQTNIYMSLSGNEDLNLLRGVRPSYIHVNACFSIRGHSTFQQDIVEEDSQKR